jgi:hypothetical protein
LVALDLASWSPAPDPTRHTQGFVGSTKLRKLQIRDCLVTRGSHVSLHLELQDSSARTDRARLTLLIKDEPIFQSFLIFFCSPSLPFDFRARDQLGSVGLSSRKYKAFTSDDSLKNLDSIGSDGGIESADVEAEDLVFKSEDPTPEDRIRNRLTLTLVEYVGSRRRNPLTGERSGVDSLGFVRAG